MINSSTGHSLRSLPWDTCGTDHIFVTFLVPVVDIEAHTLGEEVVEYVYPVKDEK